MRKHQFLALPFVISITIFLSGCAGIAIEGAKVARSELIISQNIDAAQAGDAQAQFNVGEAYCCSVHEGSGLYNTQTSVEWLCRSARQGFTPAMFKLGKIFSGDVIDGIEWKRRIAQGIVGTSTNVAVAAVWLQFAADNGEPDAQERLQEVWDEMDEHSRESAQTLYRQGTDTACLWEEVISSEG